MTLLDPDAGGERKVRYCCAYFFVVFLEMAAVIGGVHLGVEKLSCLKSADRRIARGVISASRRPGAISATGWGAYLLCDDGSVVVDAGQILNQDNISVVQDHHS